MNTPYQEALGSTLISRGIRERIILVAVTMSDRTDDETQESLDELSQLIDTAGADEVARVTQRRDSPDSTYYIGKGKAEELKERSNARGYADYNSPLVLDINKNEKFDLSNVWQEKNPVRFDINADGKKVRTGWTTGDALLVLDVNKNGTIDSGSELFGENSHSLSGDMKNHFTNFQNGYQALAQYDQNQDGRIDSRDQVFAKLGLWIDANKNGLSEKSELKELTVSGVKSLSLAYTKTGTKDKFFMVEMNEVRLVSSFEFTDGSVGRMADIWFASKADETAAAQSPAGVK